ncbi:hypothetical protein GC176_06635 [bacterium]|nr:hypothetical protein [bacterium]
MEQVLELPAEVQQQLDELRAHLRRTVALRGFGRLLLIGTSALLAVTVSDFLFDFEASTRSLLLSGLVLLCGVVSVFGVVRPFLRRLPDEEIAALAERRFPELRERLTSLVELSDERLPESERGSALMREMLQRETVRGVRRNDLLDAVASGRAVRCTVTGMFAVAACLFCWLLFPDPSRLLVARLFNPWGNYASAGPLTFEITPGDCVVARGTDVSIAASITWRDKSDDPIPEPVTLVWENAAGQVDRRELRFDADANAFVAVVPDAQESFQFRIAAARTRSQSVAVTVEDAPQIVTASLEVTPPAYVGLPRQSFDGVTGEMAAFEHSQLRFKLTFNKPVESAEVEWLGPLIIPKEDRAAIDDAANRESIERHVGGFRNELTAVDELPRVPLTLSDDRRSASLESTATVQGTLAFRLADPHGLLNPDEPFRHLKIERDQPPQLEVAGGQQDTARPSDVYPFELAVSDDVGVEQLELRISSREGLDVVQTVPTEELGKRTLTHRFRVDLAKLGVQAGTILRLQARAADGRPVPRPNEVWSAVRYVAVSDTGDAPGTNDLLAQQKQLHAELQAIREGLQQATVASDELQKQATEAAESDKPLAGAEKLDELARREAELTDRLQKLAEQLRERPLFDKVAATAERTAGNELAPLADRLLEARDAPAQQQAKTLKQNGDATDLAAEQLRELESRFDRLAELEQDLLELNRIAERAGRLADDAERLSELRAELDAAQQAAKSNSDSNDSDSNEGQTAETERLAAAQNELAAAQQQLQGEYRELADYLNSLLAECPEVLDAARDQQLERLSRLAQQASQLADREGLLAQALTEENPATNLQTAGDTQQAADASNASSPKIAGESSAQVGEAEQAPSFDELIQRQRELAAEAAEVGLAAAESQGRESPAATSALDSALSALQSQQQAEGGRFAEAARQAQQAADAAQQAQEALANEQPALASRAEDVASGQRELAREFEALQNSEPRRSAARQAQQQQIADAASQLAELLGELSESLGAEPLGLNEPGQNAATAQQATQSATQTAGQAVENLQNGSPDAAAQAAQQSAESLREAASSATGQQSDSQTRQPPASDAGQSASGSGQPTDQSGQPVGGAEASSGSASSQEQPTPGSPTISGNPAGDTPSNDVPGELAAQVVAAAQQLLQAQQQLGDAIVAAQPSSANGQPASGSPTANQSGQPTPGEAAASSPGSAESGQSGQQSSSPSAASNQNDPAANSAATNGKPGGSESSPGQPGEASNANSSSQSGQKSESSSGSAGDPSAGGPAGQQASPAAESLRRAAQALAQAAGLLSGASQQFAPQNGLAQGEPGRGMSNGENSQLASELGSDGTGAAGFEEAESPLELQLRQQVMRDWGRLPVTLRTEILQSSDRKTNGEYAEIIKLYFEQVAAEEGKQGAASSGQRPGNNR